MKNTLIVLVIGLLIGIYAPIKAQKKQNYILNCQFKGLPDKTKVYLVTQEKDTVQAVLSEGNRFKFIGRQEPEGRFHFIMFDTLVTDVPSKAIFLTNKSIKIDGLIGKSDVNIIGSPEQDQYKALLSFSSELGKAVTPEIRSIKSESDFKSKKIRDDARLSESERKLELEKIDQEFKKADEQIRLNVSRLIKSWILDRKTSLFASYAMLSSLGNLVNEHKKELFNAFPQATKESYYAGPLKVETEAWETSASLIEGEVIPNFFLKNAKGGLEKIHEVFKGSKFTLIDCWASWCKPCRAEIPKLKRIYDKYKTKGVNILGISSDKKESDWKKAVLEDNTPWMHLIQDNGNFNKKFNIQAIPAYILVDNEGRMIAFDCAMSGIQTFGGSLRGKDLENKLEELLNKRN